MELQRTAQEQGPMTRRRSARPGSEDTPRASSGLLPEVGEVQAEEGLGHPGPPPLQAEAVQVRAAPAASTQLQRIIETCRQPGIPSLLCIKVGGASPCQPGPAGACCALRAVGASCGAVRWVRGRS